MGTIQDVFTAHNDCDLDTLGAMSKDTDLSVAVAAIQARCAIKARLDGKVNVALQYEAELDAAYEAAGI